MRQTDSSEFAQLARERAQDVAGIDIDFRPALIEDLPYPDGHFDVAFSSLMVHHLPPAVRLSGLREVLRVLKAGGQFILADFDRGGRLPTLLRQAGFTDVRSLGKAWLSGIVALWEARRS